MSIEPYSFSFVAASALVEDCRTVAKTYLQQGDWDKVKVIVLEENLLMRAKQSTAKRIFVELCRRLQLLNFKQLEILANGTMDEAKQIAWLSIVKCYTYIFDFALEVICDRYFFTHEEIALSDYILYFENKRYTHNEITQLSELTCAKVRQVIFRMLEQVGLIDNIRSKKIIRPVLSMSVEKIIMDENPKWLLAFLYTEAEIKNLLNN